MAEDMGAGGKRVTCPREPLAAFEACCRGGNTTSGQQIFGRCRSARVLRLEPWGSARSRGMRRFGD